MKRNLKALGLTLIAALAMSGLASQAASAAVDNHEFWGTAGGPATSVLTGEQVGQHVFSVGGVEVKCSVAKFKGTVHGATVDHVAVNPVYSNCLVGGVVEVTVDTAGCTYTFDSDTTLNGGVKDAPVRIVCSSGNEIRLTGACETRVPVQGPIHGVTYKNLAPHGPGGKDAVEVKATVTGIKATTMGGFGCALAGLPFAETTFNNATYTGNTTVTGYQDLGSTLPANHVYTEGSQIDAAVEFETAN